uniref:Uncharacterized protein n=1 Tax=Vespula pensylvanica TaxID=30213 RepID=A0A834PFF3_VESPE|nr:hypothetical protein H0235_001125 [Vespula pensylvanica]
MPTCTSKDDRLREINENRSFCSTIGETNVPISDSCLQIVLIIWKGENDYNQTIIKQMTKGSVAIENYTDNFANESCMLTNLPGLIVFAGETFNRNVETHR